MDDKKLVEYAVLGVIAYLAWSWVLTAVRGGLEVAQALDARSYNNDPYTAPVFYDAAIVYGPGNPDVWVHWGGGIPRYRGRINDGRTPGTGGY